MDEHEAPAQTDNTRRDGFASLAILALTIMFIVVVLVALI